MTENTSLALNVSNSSESANEWELANAINNIFLDRNIDEQNKLYEAKNMLTSVILSSCTTKEQAVLFFYGFVNEMEKYDPTGNICTKVIEFDLFADVYRGLGFSINTTYQKGFKINNFNAYNFDIFANEIFPMYTTGMFGIKTNIIEDMAFPDRFLNIFFRSIQLSYKKDLKTASNVVSYLQKMGIRDQSAIENDYLKTIEEIDHVFKIEVQKIMTYLSEADQKRVYDIINKKLFIGQDQTDVPCSSTCSLDKEDIIGVISQVLLSSEFVELSNKSSQSVINGISRANSKLEHVLSAIEVNTFTLKGLVEQERNPSTSFAADEVAEKVSYLLVDLLVEHNKKEQIGTEEASFSTLNSGEIAQQVFSLLKNELNFVQHPQITLEQISAVVKESTSFSSIESTLRDIIVASETRFTSLLEKNMESVLLQLEKAESETIIESTNGYTHDNPYDDNPYDDDEEDEDGGYIIPPLPIEPIPGLSVVSEQKVVELFDELLRKIQVLFDANTNGRSDSVVVSETDEDDEGYDDHEATASNSGVELFDFINASFLESKSEALKVMNSLHLMVEDNMSLKTSLSSIIEQNNRLLSLYEKMATDYAILKEDNAYIKGELQREIKESEEFRKLNGEENA